MSFRIPAEHAQSLIQGNGPNRLTIHHRKPTSIGGEDSERNTSIVRRFKHEAWHNLFSNCPADGIQQRFVQLYNRFVVDATLHKTERKGWKYIKRQRSWRRLFGDMTLEQMMQDINEVWIDPDFRLGIETRQELETIIVLLAA